MNFITENITENIEKLKRESKSDIWLVGGGQVITLLLESHLIDEMQICYVPAILGVYFPVSNKPKESNGNS